MTHEATEATDEQMREAQEKADREGCVQYVLIEPVGGKIEITRIRLAGDHVLATVHPSRARDDA